MSSHTHTHTAELSIAEKETHLPFIDGLRGIAILGVLMVHSSQYAGNSGPGSFGNQLIQNYVNAGARGVMLFFIISAFTLFISSTGRFEKDQYPYLYFYIRRIFRIIPLWWIAAIIFSMLNGFYPRGFFATALMYFGFFRFDRMYEVVPFGWSIFVEESFYLFLPLIITFIKNLKRSIFFSGSLIMLMYLWYFIARKMAFPKDNSFVYLFPFACWYCFGFGITLYYAVRENDTIKRLVSNAKYAHFMDIASVFLIYRWITIDFVYPAIALSLFFLTAYSEHTLIGKICRNFYLRRMGIYCYSIYLFHHLILDFFIYCKFFKFFNIENSSVGIKFSVLFISIIPVCFVLGHFSFKYVERPCVMLGKKALLYITAKKAAIA